MKPFGIAVGDLNGDGKLDLVVVNSDNENVAVLLGNGDGTFRTPVTYALGSDASGPHIALGDFNNDGKLDVAVALPSSPQHNTGEIVILLGNGDGTLSTPLHLPGYASPGQLIPVDLNGDKKTDLVIPGAILFGNGDGTFQPIVYLQGAGNGNTESGVAIADVNGDGRLDIVTVPMGFQTPAMLVYLQNADGSFGAPSAYSLPLGSYRSGGAITAGDINGDGKVDVVVGANDTGIGDIFYGNGDGTFQSPLKFTVFSGVNTMLLADFNNDKKPDLEVGNFQSDPGVIVFTNPGDGTFDWHHGALLTTGGRTTQVAYGDFNGDGVLDVVSCDSLGNVVSVFLSTIGTTVSISASPYSINFGQQVTLTATVVPTVGNSNQPTGTVTFLDGNTSLGSGTLANGATMLAVNSLTTGTHNITASYSGDTNFVAGNSAGLAQVGVIDFSIAPGSSSLTVSAGGTARTSIIVAALGGTFSSAVALSCTGAPSLSTCNVSPGSVTPGGGSAQATLTIQTTAPSARNIRPHRTLWAYALWLPFMGVLLPGINRRRAILVASVALSLLLLISACGGSGNNNTNSNKQPGTPSGNYSITITAVSGSLSHSTTVTLNVQ